MVHTMNTSLFHTFSHFISYTKLAFKVQCHMTWSITKLEAIVAWWNFYSETWKKGLCDSMRSCFLNKNWLKGDIFLTTMNGVLWWFTNTYRRISFQFPLIHKTKANNKIKKRLKCLNYILMCSNVSCDTASPWPSQQTKPDQPVTIMNSMILRERGGK